jgi:ketosteroid isomerase-like protein
VPSLTQAPAGSRDTARIAETNEEIIRAIYAAWGQGDVDAIVSRTAAGVVLVPLRAQLEDTVYRGREGVRKFWDDLHADWDELVFPIDELRASGDTIAVISRFTGRGKVSGVKLDVAIGQVWELEDGLIVRMQAYTDPDDALRAAGFD